MQTKPIKTEFKKYKENFKQILRKDNICIYERTYIDFSGDVRVNYEVWRLRVGNIPPHMEKSFLGYTHMEFGPSENDFGKFGWAYNNKIDALAKFDILCSQTTQTT